MHTENTSWFEDNQRYLMTELAGVKERLELCKTGSPQPVKILAPAAPAHQSQQELAMKMTPPPNLHTLCHTFRLSSFECKILLMCAGLELDSSFSQLYAQINGDSRSSHPTFGLAMSAFPDAHWSALNPAGPLRYWRFIELGAREGLTASSLRIDERILHYLTGLSYTDERLMDFIKPLAGSVDQVPTYQAVADRMQQVWSCREIDPSASLPVIQLCGRETAAKQSIAAAACSGLGFSLYKISAQVLPTAAGEMDALIRLWEREAFLEAKALLIDCNTVDMSTKELERVITPFVESVQSLLIVSSRGPLPALLRPAVSLYVSKPSSEEQRSVWKLALGERSNSLDGQVDRLVSQFNLSIPAIQAAGSEALTAAASMEKDLTDSAQKFGRVVWDICRIQSHPKLDDLAQRIEPKAGWDDLVLPEFQKQILRDISLHVRQRARVYDTWGFAAKSCRGLGISALFSGESGTGKTMAAEVLANELRLDLYRIDLSQVVSKYIGETEKNLRRIFDAAEEGGVILFFDEADALFGKRTEVKDSHDRYANIEVSYLLMRMEAYRGLAILTTNMREALDPAFLRRIRFIVKFPFPSPELRAEIWRHIFPDDTPTDTLDCLKLARLNITGGNIRNIALNAAFLAAGIGEALNMRHLLQAAHSEYAKLEKTLNAVEIEGWDR